jgi:hypothetical protein
MGDDRCHERPREGLPRSELCSALAKLNGGCRDHSFLLHFFLGSSVATDKEGPVRGGLQYSVLLVVYVQRTVYRVVLMPLYGGSCACIYQYS